jgi:uncharacterized protein
MSAPASIDTLRFARAGECLSADVPVAALERLSGGLASSDGMVRYRLCGVQRNGRPCLELVVEARVQMICQRCLEPFSVDVASRSVMPVARDEAQLELWEREDPLLDALVADAQSDVQTLVEDELLLSLPAVPRHPEGECSAKMG